ncbi:MAG: MerR family transcriptional regulator [Coriobacteriia bacterium]|nr:MerR family transcriptional regulator [Coriobacteriia bacterium]
MASRDYFTIGEVVQKLAIRYPELSVSKLRFLEDEDLVSPQRTPGGYRKFSKKDMDRVEIILRLQKEFFFPLGVIREKLIEFDSGIMPKELLENRAETADKDFPLTPNAEGKFSVKDSLNKLGIPESFIMDLSEYGLIDVSHQQGTRSVENADIPLVQAAWKLRKFGVEPRHLRMYVTFSQRESQLFGQILIPTYRHKTPESRTQLNENLTEISIQLDHLRGRLSRKALVEELHDLL